MGRDERLLLAVFFENDQSGGGVFVLGQQFQAFRWTEHVDGGGEAIGEEAGGGDDGHAGAAGNGFAGAGIEDVRIAPAFYDQVLPGIARCGDGLVFEPEEPRGRIVGVERCESDFRQKFSAAT